MNSKPRSLLQPILIGLTCVAILGILEPTSASSPNLESWKEGWVELNCDGEPSLVLLPNRAKELDLLLGDNEALREIVGEVAGKPLSPKVLNGLRAIARYGLGEFSRQSVGTSAALLSLVFNEEMIQSLFDDVTSELEAEARQACLDQDQPREYIWKTP